MIEHRYVKEGEVAKITGLAVQTLRNDRHLCKGIPYVKAGRAVRYFLPDVFEHMERKKIEPDGR